VAFSLASLLPETFQCLVTLGLLMQSLSGSRTLRDDASWTPVAAALGVGVALKSLAASGVMFHGAYQVDALSQFFKLAVAIGFLIATLNAVRQPTLEKEHESDYFMFLSFSALGLMFLASAVELVTVYVALEISSYALYAVIPLRAQDKRAAEAGIKYILFGAAATALSLYGLSYILASQHSTHIAVLARLDWSWASNPLAVIGLTLFLAGMFYKLALFPFHFWAPDVYQGASNETAAFAATLPKLGAVAVLVRLAAVAHAGHELLTVFAVLGAASMTFGNLAALAQRDLKRMLGYSSVAHAGYVTLGLVAGTKAGLAAAAFYSLVYILMNLTCFWIICRLADRGQNLGYEDLDGLYRRSPWLALALAVAAFALVGLPPTAGFMGKLFLLTAAWSHGFDWLVVVAAVNTAFSIYYYLSLVRHAYTAEVDDPERLKPAPVSNWALLCGTGLAAVLLVLGAVPGPVFDLALRAGAQLLP